MNKSNNIRLIKVDAEFHKLFKSEAAMNGISMLELTRRKIAEQNPEYREEFIKNAKKRRFDFSF